MSRLLVCQKERNAHLRWWRRTRRVEDGITRRGALKELRAFAAGRLPAVALSRL